MQDNAANPKQVRRAQKQARVRDREDGDVVRMLMRDYHGRRWVWDKLASAGIFQTTFNAESPYITSFTEGRRSFGLELLANIMQHCPDEFIQAQREANERASTDDARNARDSDDSDTSPGEQRTGGEDDGRDVEDTGTEG